MMIRFYCHMMFYGILCSTLIAFPRKHNNVLSRIRYKISQSGKRKDIEQANLEESYMKTRVQIPFTQVKDVDSFKLIHELKNKGVTRLNGVLSELQVETLRYYVLNELRTCVVAVNDGSVASSELFGNIKMADQARWDLKLPCESSIVSDTLHSILQKDSILGDTLRGVTDKNGGGDIYELNAFVTTTGAKRQVIHSDTFWSPLPTLFTVTIALQDTDQTMG